MTTALITHPTPAGTIIESEEAGRSALATLPREWVEPVGFFALSKLYLLRTRGPLCVNLRYWISKGLTLDDAKMIFRRLCDPDIARTHNFENQLMADLAGMVADVLRRRRLDAEMRKLRAEFGDPRRRAKAAAEREQETLVSVLDRTRAGGGA